MEATMYSKNELLIFSILNTLEQLINPNLIYKLFKFSLNQNINIFRLSKEKLKEFLENTHSFSEEQKEKILKIFEHTFISEIKIQAELIYKTCTENSISLLFYAHENYPKSLLNIKRPPYVLYIKGNFNLKNFNVLALVGTRNISEKGINFTENFSKNLQKNNYFNISGLALGVDSLGHKNTLGATGAILAQGLMTEIYPKENKNLAYEIIKNNGFLLSELPPYINISVNNLINRNRIQVGLADIIVIAETGIKGGTVHTFKFAREQKKKIFIADFNKNFIEKYRKEVIIIKNFDEFIKKSSIQLNQGKLF